jgi:tRNA-binding EMAP/Myf-like protein
MKTTLGWIKQHLDTDATLDSIVETLTRIGLEVEGVENPGAALAAFKVARVLSAAPHPQADKLQVLSVDAGDGPLQVVCGAPNARAGMLGVFGPAGAVVPSNAMVLKVAAIRGVESNGMMCSARELEIGEGHDGIIELPEDAPVGTPYPDYAGLNDPVIDVTLAVLLLDLTKHSPALLAGLPLNPPADSAVTTTFPFFAPANGGQPGAGTGTAFNFRTNPASDYVRVDRMGQPAVATALIGTAMKNAYNDANPSDDVANTFVPEIVAQLTALHNALADDLIGLSLTPCSK